MRVLITSSIGTPAERAIVIHVVSNLVDDAFSAVIATGLSATPPENEYPVEEDATNRFYRIEVE